MLVKDQALSQARATALMQLDAVASCHDCSPDESESLLLTLTQVAWFEQQRRHKQQERNLIRRRSPDGIKSNARRMRGTEAICQQRHEN